MSSRARAWRTIGAPGIMTRSARCAIRRSSSARRASMAYSFSISPTTAANDRGISRDSWSEIMTEPEGRDRASPMPLTSPAYPRGPYRFIDREYLIITYRTDPEKLRAVVPEPLEIEEPVVKYEFIRMPDSTGFGDYTETGQVIPVRFDGRKGSYTHCMFLNDE